MGCHVNGLVNALICILPVGSWSVFGEWTDSTSVALYYPLGEVRRQAKATDRDEHVGSRAQLDETHY